MWGFFVYHSTHIVDQYFVDFVFMANKVKVFGTGFGRTGTNSLKIALEKLGMGPCYHMKEIVIRPAHIKMWYDVAQGEHPKWHKVFKNFNSGVDYPLCLFYEDLMETFPDAKFILTLRDFESWYKSTVNTVYKVPTMLPDWFLTLIYPIKKLIMMQNTLIWGGLFNNNFNDKESAQLVYNEHIDKIKRTIPRDRLLIYYINEGWEPLCEFLNIDVPVNIPFPKVNDTAEILRNFAIIRAIPYFLIFSMIVFSVILFISLG